MVVWNVVPFGLLVIQLLTRHDYCRRLFIWRYRMNIARAVRQSFPAIAVGVMQRRALKVWIRAVTRDNDSFSVGNGEVVEGWRSDPNLTRQLLQSIDGTNQSLSHLLAAFIVRSWQFVQKQRNACSESVVPPIMS